MKIYGIETKRCTTVEYEAIAKELKPVVEKLFNTEVKFLKYFHNKDSHGDLDILILNTGNLGNVAQKIKDEFQVEHIHSNGGVYSFAFEDYQIDIIPQPLRNWISGPMFFDYDPTGNLMGKIAHKFGLKYGFEGLVYPFRNFSGRLTKDIVISKDSEKIFDFLGFSFNRYSQGFDTVEEIFEFIINSKHFSVDNFLMENLTHIDRKRNAKRKTYQGFLTYVKENKIKSNFKFQKDKSFYVDYIDRFFPEANFKKQLDGLKRKDKEMKEISEKFNGNLIIEWLDGRLQGKELGQAITGFKSEIESKVSDWNEYILSHTPEEIKLTFLFYIN